MMNTLNEIYMGILLIQISLDPSLPLYMPRAALKSA